MRDLQKSVKEEHIWAEEAQLSSAYLRQGAIDAYHLGHVLGTC